MEVVRANGVKAPAFHAELRIRHGSPESLGKMKKAIAALLIATIALAVLAAHAWYTWGAADALAGVGHDDTELFQYSLFLESFVFMVSASYFVGPKIYRMFREEDAALKFEGEKEKVSRLVHIYAAVCVILRRIALDPKLGVPISETVIAILLISIPPVWTILRGRIQRQKRIPSSIRVSKSAIRDPQSSHPPAITG
jgi:hypothetical protein